MPVIEESLLIETRKMSTDVDERISVVVSQLPSYKETIMDFSTRRSSRSRKQNFASERLTFSIFRATFQHRDRNPSSLILRKISCTSRQQVNFFCRGHQVVQNVVIGTRWWIWRLHGLWDQPADYCHKHMTDLSAHYVSRKQTLANSGCGV